MFGRIRRESAPPDAPATVPIVTSWLLGLPRRPVEHLRSLTDSAGSCPWSRRSTAEGSNCTRGTSTPGARSGSARELRPAPAAGVWELATPLSGSARNPRSACQRRVAVVAGQVLVEVGAEAGQSSCRRGAARRCAKPSKNSEGSFAGGVHRPDELLEVVLPRGAEQGQLGESRSRGGVPPGDLDTEVVGLQLLLAAERPGQGEVDLGVGRRRADRPGSARRSRSTTPPIASRPRYVTVPSEVWRLL